MVDEFALIPPLYAPQLGCVVHITTQFHYECVLYFPPIEVRLAVLITVACDQCDVSHRLKSWKQLYFSLYICLV